LSIGKRCGGDVMYSTCNWSLEIALMKYCQLYKILMEVTSVGRGGGGVLGGKRHACKHVLHENQGEIFKLRFCLNCDNKSPDFW
jgi:hypothetical protein